MIVAAVLSMFSALQANLFAASRIARAMARDRTLPSPLSVLSLETRDSRRRGRGHGGAGIGDLARAARRECGGCGVEPDLSHYVCPGPLGSDSGASTKRSAAATVSRTAVSGRARRRWPGVHRPGRLSGHCRSVGGHHHGRLAERRRHFVSGVVRSSGTRDGRFEHGVRSGAGDPARPHAAGAWCRSPTHRTPKR